MPDVIQIAIARKTKLLAELQELERFIRVGESLSKGVENLRGELASRPEPMPLTQPAKDDAEDEQTEDNVKRMGA